MPSLIPRDRGDVKRAMHLVCMKPPLTLPRYSQHSQLWAASFHVFFVTSVVVKHRGEAENVGKARAAHGRPNWIHSHQCMEVLDYFQPCPNKALQQG
ncbi:hypothetical protein HaLaN_12415, partial [Haematococcus lacustris]